MNRIKDAWCIQIEVNNFCPHSCSYCTRFTRHVRPELRYNMTPAELQGILSALHAHGYVGKIGLIGGEPTIHPQFDQVCEVVKDHWTGLGLWAGLWTSGGKRYESNLDMIGDCFSWTAYNDKSDPRCHHQPMTMASKDVVPDAGLRAELIDNCWVQRIWCPSITPKGVFFCECAAAWDRMLDGPGGWPVQSGWLEYGPADYKKQMWSCQLCGMPVPMPDQSIGSKERVSHTVLIEMMKHGCVKIRPEDVDIESDFVDEKVYAERIGGWAPGEYTPGRAKGGA